MDFDFSDEQKALKDQVRRLLDNRCTSAAVHRVADSGGYDAPLWKALAEIGAIGAAIPECYGGAGAGYLELCVIAEELGRALAPVPMCSTAYLSAELILSSGSEEQKRNWLPRIASGDAIGTVAVGGLVHQIQWSERMIVDAGKVTGALFPVPDGMVADFVIIAAGEGSGDDEQLYLVPLDQREVERHSLESIDPTRGQARIVLRRACAEPLGGSWTEVTAALDRAAILLAFEQIGGADRALDMARDHALQRIAFGRPIGSFQAVKHMLADMYVAATLARSNAYYGAWALSTNAADLPAAAASARVSASKAYRHSARNNIQVHGGMGFTWALDCHLHYRRANLLALTLGSVPQWEDALIERLCCQPSV